MRIIVALVFVALLAGCTTDPIRIESKPIVRVPLILPGVDRYYSHRIKWTIITPSNAIEEFAKMRKRGLPLAVIGLTGDGYENLGLANGDKAKLIRQLQIQIKAYKEYYIAVEQRDEDHNKELTTPK